MHRAGWTHWRVPGLKWVVEPPVRSLNPICLYPNVFRNSWFKISTLYVQHIDTRALSSYCSLVVQDVKNKTAIKVRQTVHGWGGAVISLRDEAQGKGKFTKHIALRAIHMRIWTLHTCGLSVWTVREQCSERVVRKSAGPRTNPQRKWRPWSEHEQSSTNRDGDVVWLCWRSFFYVNMTVMLPVKGNEQIQATSSSNGSVLFTWKVNKLHKQLTWLCSITLSGLSLYWY